jgi:Cu(I)/Ag(I) efflux system membrane protein CusA/SilA
VEHFRFRNTRGRITALSVGLIVLLGVDAETGVFVLLYLDLAYEEAKREGRLRTLADLQEAVRH